MSKQSPFFKFDAMQWLGGSIQSCTLEEKGLFIDLCALYWKDFKPVQIDAKFKVRYRYLEGTLSNLIGTLSDLGFIKQSEAGITVDFLDALMIERQEFIEKCSKAGKKSKSMEGRSSNKKEESREKKEENRKKKEDKSKPQKVEDVKTFYDMDETVKLTDAQYEKLCTGWGRDGKKYTAKQRDEAIDRLSNWMRANGKKYACHYSALQGWVYDRIMADSTKPGQQAYGICPKTGAKYSLKPS